MTTIRGKIKDYGMILKVSRNDFSSQMNTMIPYVITHYKFIINHNSITIITYFMVEMKLLIICFT